MKPDNLPLSVAAGSFPWGYFKCWRLDANLGRFNKIW